jgi:hypothetical protein
LPATHCDANSAETHAHSAASDTNTAETHADSTNSHSASVRSDADSLETDADSANSHSASIDRKSDPLETHSDPTNSHATPTVTDTVPACFTNAEKQEARGGEHAHSKADSIHEKAQANSGAR